MTLFGRIISFLGSFLKAKAVVDTTTNQVDANTTATTTTVTTAPADILVEDVQKAIDLVNNVRKALASPVAVLITDIIPSTIDNEIRVILVNDLPIVAAGLTFLKDALSPDRSTALQQVLSNIKMSDKPNLDAFYHTLSAKVLQVVSGGTISWSKAILAVEYVLKEAVLNGIDTAAGAAVMQAVTDQAPAAV